MEQKFNLKYLTWPIFVESFIIKAMGMLNVFLLSRYSEEAVAAIGVSNQLIQFINMIFIIVTLGMAVIVSQNLGAGNEERAASASSTAVYLNVVLGIIVGVVVILFHSQILTMMNLTGQVLEYAEQYFSIIGGLCVLQGLNFTLRIVMRNYGQVWTSMIAFFGMNLLNLLGNMVIILKPFGEFTFGLQGIEGIAIWTVFSQVIGAVVMVVFALKYKIGLHMEKPFPRAMARQILSIGIPGAGDNLAYNIALISLMYFITPMGTSAVASFTYSSTLISFVVIFGYSVGQSTQILISRYVGARDFEGAYRLAYRGTFIAVALDMIAMTVLFLLQRPLLHLFSASEEVMSIIFWCLIINIFLEIGRPLNLVIGISVRGAGDVKWAIRVSSFSILLVCIPLGYLFTQVFMLGVPGVFLALLIDEWLRGHLMARRWRSRKWEEAALIKG